MLSGRFEIKKKIMDKIIEEVVNEQLHAEIWSSNLCLVFQLYFFEQKLPMLSSWLDVQIQKKSLRIRKLSEFLILGKANVVIKEQVCRAEEWQSPMMALNALLVHEQYFHQLVVDFLNWVHHANNPSLQELALDLYADEMHLGDFILELLRILTKEWKRRLPFE